MDKKYSINSLCILNPFDFKKLRENHTKAQKIYKKKNSLNYFCRKTN